MFSEIVVCSLIYVAIVAIAFSPKPAAVKPETDPINYFPEPTEPQADQVEKLPGIETKKPAVTEVKKAIA